LAKDEWFLCSLPGSIKMVFFVKRFTTQTDCGGSLFTSQGRAAKASLELLSKAANVNIA
jgi:hypothetical protein